MEKNRFMDLMAEGKMTRRQMTTALASVGLGLVTMPVFKQPAAAAVNDITYYTWASYEVPELHPSYVEKY
ncbi:MAG: hypothetical protein WEC00_05290, partial [Dongiaceae bacterium]